MDCTVVVSDVAPPSIALPESAVPEHVVVAPTAQRFTISLESIIDLWCGLPAMAKWGVAIVAFLLVPALWRLVGGKVIQLIGALLVSFVILVLMDVTCEVWQPIWQSIGPRVFGADTLDLAWLLAAVPLVGWMVALIRELISK
jgi:hypothetical protein